MIDEVITLQTAKLAKKLNFDLRSPAFYGCDEPASGRAGNKLMISDWIKITELGGYDTQKGTMIYSAPTQSMLQRWIREKFNVSVEVNYKTFGVSSCNGWYYSFMDIKKQSRIGYKDNGADLFHGFTSYQDAMEVGLKTALEFIYNGKKRRKKTDKKNGSLCCNASTHIGYYNADPENQNVAMGAIGTFCDKCGLICDYAIDGVEYQTNGKLKEK